MYRDEASCHICQAETRTTCPACGKGVCSEHKLAVELARAPEGTEHLRRIAARLGGPDVCLACAEAEAEGARGPAVTIYRGGDPVQVGMLVEGLLEAGFDARALGTRNAALLGAGQLIFDQRIEVPEKQAAEAATLVDALIATGAPGEKDDAAGKGEDDDEPLARGPQRRWVNITGTVIVVAFGALILASVLPRC